MPSAIVSSRRGDAAVAGVDLDRLHALLLGGVEGVADPAERRLRALDAVDDQVVVGARRVVGAGRLVLAALLGEVGDGELDERVVRAGLLTGAGDVERRVREVGGVRRPDLGGQLVVSLQLAVPSDSGPTRA